ncbi:DUF3857 domain-containing transglutaminase family protein [Albibacterium indicum]|uniref:DUF3857 domain-containing transglutaminase family protein n=1 Tax=Albibacterium indicum TaxID=2292082 RepID=UPI000E524C15|nr:DUF3857 domain-containing transglutaminase family protein [Pedobacter indicus]
MRKICFIFFLFLLPATLLAQNNYAVDHINKNLLARASSVIRTMDMNIDIKNTDQFSYTVKRVITVLNENGNEDAAIRIWYDKSRQIRSIRGAVYDQFGRQTAKISEKSFSDISASDNNSLFLDSRLKVFRPNPTMYPYTLEIEYEIRSKQTLNLPDWYPVGSSGVSLEKATLVVNTSSGFPLRYKEVNYPGSVEASEADGIKTYHWETTNKQALKDEPYSPAPETFLTSVRLAPEHFSYEKVTGSFSNWEEYGKWMYDALLQGRNEIPPQTASHIRNLTADMADPWEKAKAIYEFVQKKTRYVSIQVGIGGFQPFLASQVDQTGYGDCKALVNYTQGLLAVVGIPSDYVVVASGDKKKNAIPDFASINQFDHVILRIPFESDTAWVDCTSKDNPFDYLGTFTDDRLAVACTENGGELVRTPRYLADNSKQIRTGRMSLNEEGAIKGEIVTEFEGWQYDNRNFLIGEPLREQLKEVPKIYPIGNLTVANYTVDQQKGNNPKTVEKLSFTARNYGAANADLMFVPLNKVNQSPLPPELRSRENDLYINRGYIDVDSIVYELPEGFTVERLPNEISLEHPFGIFSMEFEQNGQELLYSRKIQMNQGQYNREQYNELVGFFRQIAEADKSRLVLKKKSL